MDNKKIEFTPEDARETYEMLRASHTLLRMAIGAISMIETPKSPEDAESILAPFRDCGKRIVECCEVLTDFFLKK